MKVCSKDGCGSKAKARGLCNRHYLQYLHAGGEKKVVLFGPLEDRWHKLYSVDEKTGCWVWQGHVTPEGCPVVSDKNKRRPATQISYEKLHGPIPAGYFVWRTCKTHGCIKPEHLSLERPSTPVSQYELDYRKFLLDYTALEKRSFALMRFDPKSVVADVDDWGEAVCFKVAGHCVIVDADRFEEVMKHKWYIWLADKRRMHPCPYWDAPDGKGKLSRLILPCP